MMNYQYTAFSIMQKQIVWPIVQTWNLVLEAASEKYTINSLKLFHYKGIGGGASCLCDDIIRVRFMF